MTHYPNYNDIIYKIDWKLLHKQKRTLVNIVSTLRTANKNKRQPVSIKHIEGLLNFIDILEDRHILD